MYQTFQCIIQQGTIINGVFNVIAAIPYVSDWKMGKMKDVPKRKLLIITRPGEND